MFHEYADGVGGESDEEHIALIALLSARPEGMRWADIAAEVLESGSARAVWDRTVPSALIPVPGEPDPLEAAAKDLALWAGQGHTVLTILDARYPARLRGVHQAPPVLFARGVLVTNDPAVSVVGSREASDRGLAIASDVAHGLVGEGVTVVAGLAVGIDAAAHRSALASGGRTVAVIGTGINRVYPAANRDLHEEIASRGLLLSQFWPDAPPQKHTFLMRNATMSGYGLATVVVEAGEKSGARAQARMAVEHGRPVILTTLVVDRNEWARRLLGRPGVHVAGGSDDVLEVVRNLTAASEVVDDALRRLVSA